MELLLGFDPGGAGAYGWAVAEHSARLPLSLRATGVTSNAEEAVTAALAVTGAGDEIKAAGIDAPLFWVSAGDRIADATVRTAICARGSAGGTVQHVNRLQGACLVQGMLGGILLRRRFRELPLSESHPKAFLWLTGVANAALHPSAVAFTLLTQYFSGIPTGRPDHERDAAIATLSAWAMRVHPLHWRDLYPLEQNPYSPLSSPLGYWML